MVFLLFRFCVLMRLSICLQTRPFSLSAESKSADRRLLILFLKQFRRMNRVVMVAPEGNKSEKLTYPRKSSSQNPKTDHLKGQTSDKLSTHLGNTSDNLYWIYQLLYINRNPKISQIKLFKYQDWKFLKGKHVEKLFQNWNAFNLTILLIH